MPERTVDDIQRGIKNWNVQAAKLRAAEARVAELEAALLDVQDGAAQQGACWCTWDVNDAGTSDVIVDPHPECPVHAPTRDLFPLESKEERAE